MKSRFCALFAMLQRDLPEFPGNGDVPFFRRRVVHEPLQFPQDQRARADPVEFDGGEGRRGEEIFVRTELGDERSERMAAVRAEHRTAVRQPEPGVVEIIRAERADRPVGRAEDARLFRQIDRREIFAAPELFDRAARGGEGFRKRSAAPEESRRIGEQLMRAELPAVGTPYMKSFEILGLIRAGFKDRAVAEIRRFWGGMMKAGATTFFEAYGEGKTGSGLYDFYDRPFGLSLCHAWSSAPAFLLPMIFASRR